MLNLDGRLLSVDVMVIAIFIALILLAGQQKGIRPLKYIECWFVAGGGNPTKALNVFDGDVVSVSTSQS